MKLYGIIFVLSVLFSVSLAHAQTFLDGPGAASSMILPFTPFTSKDQETAPTNGQTAPTNGQTAPTNGQTALTNGQTAKPRKEGDFVVNQADGSVKVSYIWEDKWQEKESWNMRYGFDVRGKVTNGYLRLFDSEKIAPELVGNFFIGWQTGNPNENLPVGINSHHAVLLGVGYRHSEYRLFQSGGDAVDDEVLTSPLVGLYYNLNLIKALQADSDASPLDIVFGLSIGHTWNDNNYRALDAYEVELTDTNNPETSEGTRHASREAKSYGTPRRQSGIGI